MSKKSESWKSYKDVKIGVYAIGADEPEEFIDRWLDSMSGADYIWVLITKANNPNTVYFREKQKDPRFINKLFVKEENIKPWRFDVARNRSLDMIDVDLVDALVCTDIDEILIEDFWDDYRKAVFEHPDFDRINYRYAWSHDALGNPDRVFWYDKTHQPTTYHWEYPVHETLARNKDATCVGEYRLAEDKIYLHHYPDNTKSRSSYLGLLEVRAQEYPDDLYGLFYLGREYTFNGKWAKAVSTMETLYLRLVTEKVNDDMCMKPAICTVMGDSYRLMGLNDLAETWLLRGIADDPRYRDNYIRLAQMYAWSNQPQKARAIIYDMQARTVFIEDWRTMPYMWSRWKTEQILADCCMWEMDYEQAAAHMQNALRNIRTETDKNYATEESFYSDLNFLEERLGRKIET